MPHNPFEQMQKTVDIVNTSPHPTNKIAATVFGTNLDGRLYSVSHTNFWPAPILKNLGMDVRLGGAQGTPGSSSGTIHAETACILSTNYCDGGSICITDPFCPNCAKNIAEAGIKTIYIDHKGFDKDFATRRADHFQTMSMQICEKAGIAIYEIRRKEQRLIPILEIPADYKPEEDWPVEIERLPPDADFIEYIAQKTGPHKMALAWGIDRHGVLHGLIARDHPAIGYTMEHDADSIRHPPENKYSLVLEPLNRLLMNAARFGINIIDEKIYCSLAPTAREQVNFAGAALRTLYIGNPNEARDEAALKALKTMREAGILIIKTLP